MDINKLIGYLESELQNWQDAALKHKADDNETGKMYALGARDMAESALEALRDARGFPTLHGSDFESSYDGTAPIERGPFPALPF